MMTATRAETAFSSLYILFLRTLLRFRINASSSFAIDYPLLIPRTVNEVELGDIMEESVVRRSVVAGGGAWRRFSCWGRVDDDDKVGGGRIGETLAKPSSFSHPLDWLDYYTPYTPTSLH
ncbi:hypothetical protein GUJ93_ZPchr0003g18632 [Zizania palustris]|uniref:Uncharacterized protein n=1 Tax=Zizania palustris TaxID=103762 RepID=A0A8J5SJN8_ZIZPA|nr:hypothetical protein GUJ93_ZPchr0003g18632 [Zizania palustris]